MGVETVSLLAIANHSCKHTVAFIILVPLGERTSKGEFPKSEPLVPFLRSNGCLEQPASLDKGTFAGSYSHGHEV